MIEREIENVLGKDQLDLEAEKVLGMQLAYRE